MVEKFNVFPALKGRGFPQPEGDVPPQQRECFEPHSRRDHAKCHSQSKPSASLQDLRYL